MNTNKPTENETLRAGYAAARLEIESLRKEHADELAVAYMCGASREKELAAQQPGAAYAAPPEEVYGSIMGAAYDFRDAHISGSMNLKRSAHAELETAPAQPSDPHAELRKAWTPGHKWQWTSAAEEGRWWSHNGEPEWNPEWRYRLAPARPVAEPGAAYAAQDSEHQRAIMEGERNASLDAYSRVVSITSAESRLYERAFTSGWDRRDRLASYGQAPAQAAPAAVRGPSDDAVMDRTRDLASSGRWPSDWVDAYRRGYADAAPTTQPAPQQVPTLHDLKAALDVFNTARAGSDKPSGYLRGIRAVLIHWEGRSSATSVQEDAARWHWIAEYLVGPRTDLDDEIVASETVNELRKLVDADRARRAPADSVLEDAARYRWLRERSITMFVNISINGEGAEIAATLDSAVDAARKQGANHD